MEENTAAGILKKAIHRMKVLNMSALAENVSMNEPVRRLFWKYVLPTLAAVIINGLYVMVDGIFIGRYVGAGGLAAINLCWPMYGVILGLGGMIGTAGAALASIEKGKGDYSKARAYVGNSICLLGVAGVLNYLLVHYLMLPSFNLQIQDAPDVITLGSKYASVLQVAGIFSIAATAFPLLIRNDDRPKLATKLMAAGAFANMIGDYVFVARFGWGMTGAAVATVGAQGVISVISLFHFFSSGANLRLRFSDLRLSFDASRKTVLLGFSSFFMYVYFSFLAALYNYMFDKYGGSVSVAAYSLVGYYSGLYYMFSEGLAAGIQPIVSYNYGAGRYYNVRRVLKKAVRVVFISAAVFLGIVYAFPEWCIRLVNDNDPELFKASMTGLRLHMATCYLEAFILVGTVYFQSVDNARTATAVSAVNLFIQIPFVILLPLKWGTEGIWLAYPVANVPLALFVFFALTRDLKRKTKRLKWERGEKRKRNSTAIFGN